MMSQKISELTEHLKSNAKDFATKRGLLMMVGKRKSLMDYLKNEDVNRYRDLVSKLGLRKYMLPCLIRTYRPRGIYLISARKQDAS